MRWFPGLVVAVVLLGVGPVPVSAAQASATQASATQAGSASGAGPPPRGVVVVERLSMDEALAVTARDRPEVAGFVSTLPVHQPVASRVLSLAAGRRGDALAALEEHPGDASGLPRPATVERIRADNPGARLGRLPPTRLLAPPGQEVAGLFTLGSRGPARAPEPLPAGDR